MAYDRNGQSLNTIPTGVDFHTQFDQAYLDVDKHGITGIVSTDRDRFGTNNPEELNYCRDIIPAYTVTPQGFEIMETLGDKAIIEIIRTRFANRKNSLDLYNGHGTQLLEQMLETDLMIISRMIATGRNLYDNSIDISNVVGTGHLDNVIGLLDVYETMMSKNGINKKLITMCQGLKQEATKCMTAQKEAAEGQISI